MHSSDNATFKAKKDLNSFPLRDISLHLPFSTNAKQRNPSYLISKIQSGWLNGSAIRLRGMGENMAGNMIIHSGCRRSKYNLEAMRTVGISVFSVCPVFTFDNLPTKGIALPLFVPKTHSPLNPSAHSAPLFSIPAGASWQNSCLVKSWKP